MVDRAGNLYIADRLNRRVRRIDAATGVITTLAGTGEAAYAGDGGPAEKAGLAEPNGLAFGSDERLLYITDVADNRVRVVTIASGMIATFAGTGAAEHSGDGGPALRAVFDAPKEMAIDRDGSLLIVDTENHAIRRIDHRTGIVTNLAGGRQGPGGDGAPAEEAGLDRPHGAVVGPDGAVYIGDTNNHRIRKVVR